MKQLLWLLLFLLTAIPTITSTTAYAQTSTSQPIIYYADYDDAAKKSYLVSLDATNLSTVDKIEIGTQIPIDMVLHPTSAIAYVANDPTNGSGIAVVDLKSRQVKNFAVQNKKIVALYFSSTSNAISESILYALSNEGELIQLTVKDFNLTIKNSILPSSSHAQKDPIVSASFGIRGFAAGITENQLISFQFRDGIYVGAAREIETPKSLQGIAVESLVQVIGSGVNGQDTTIDTYDFGSLALLGQASVPKRIFAILPVGDALYAAADDRIFVLTAAGNFKGEIPVPSPKPNFNLGKSQLAPEVLFLKSDGLTLQNGQVLYYLNSQGVTLISMVSKSIITSLPWSKHACGMQFIGDFSGTAPTVEIVSPGLSDTAINRGTPFKIELNGTPGKFNIAKYKIELSIDGGSKFTSIGEISGSEKVFNWSVPDQDIESAVLKVKAYDLGGYYQEVFSPPFRIERVIPPDTEPPTARFLNPLGNEIFTPGETINITWTSSDNVGVVSQELSLSTDAGATFPITVAAGLDGTIQSLSFQLPDLETETARLQLVVTDMSGNSIATKTPSNISIKKEPSRETEPPNAQFLNPAGGEAFFTNSNLNIIWASGDNVGVVSQDLELSLDDGQSYSTIAANLAGTKQNFVYQLVDIEADRARLRLVVRDGAGNASEAITGVFEIKRQTSNNEDKEKPRGSFIAPAGGERYLAGDKINITWSSSDNIGVTAQDLLLSTDGGSTFPVALITGVSDSTQSFSYTVPTSIQTETARLRLVVRDAAGNFTEVLSAAFAVQPPPSSADTQPPTVTISKPLGETISAGQPVNLLWKSSDNKAVTSQSISLSLDGGLTFQVVASLAGDISEYVLTGSSLLDRSMANVLIRVTATDLAGNKGSADGKISIVPVITNAVFVNKELSLMGLGFTSPNTQAGVKVIINNREIDANRIKVPGNNLIILKGGKKKLFLTAGFNSIVVKVDSLQSIPFSYIR